MLIVERLQKMSHYADQVNLYDTESKYINYKPFYKMPYKLFVKVFNMELDKGCVTKIKTEKMDWF